MKIIILLISILMLSSCTDIIDTEGNIKKELLLKKYSPSDSLKLLVTKELDLGEVSISKSKSGVISILNKSLLKTISIYKIEEANTTGLFELTHPALPILIHPGEDIFDSNMIQIKFIADAFQTGYYYDTLFLNGNKNYFVPIKVKIIY